MKRIGTIKPSRAFIGAVLAMIITTLSVSEVLSMHEIERDEQVVAQITERTKTVCAGRFLIDMPEEAKIEFRQARIDGFDIAAFNETEKEFRKRVADREAQIKAMPDYLGGSKNMESAREVKTDSGLFGNIFVHSRKVQEGTQGNGLGGVEPYRHEGITTEALVHGDGVSIDLSYENRALKWVEDLPRLVNQLVVNPDNRIPTEPGFCMDRVYVRDPLRADQREQIMMFGRLPSHPDIEFMFIVSAGLKPEPQGVLARNQAADEALSIAERMRITRLRAAPREISGLAGEELAELVVEENEARGHSFWWEVNGTEDKVFVPHLVFRMSTGNGNRQPVPSTLSDGAALGLWDKISSSIRLRTAEPEESRRVETPTTPLGTYASAGERCPESGWWLCGDGGNGIGVLGGERQYIKKGDVMPQALLLPPRTLWEKVRGLQPSFESKNRTNWKFVDHRARKRVPPQLPLAKASTPADTTMAVGVSPNRNGAHVAIGSFSSTGVPCPASGWWRCEESHALDGTRWFAQGSLLPPATFAVAPGIFGHSPNAPQAIQRRSAWRLMRLADTSDYSGHEKLGSNDDLPPSAQQA